MFYIINESGEEIVYTENKKQALLNSVGTFIIDTINNVVIYGDYDENDGITLNVVKIERLSPEIENSESCFTLSDDTIKKFDEEIKRINGNN